jgi:transcriptional regulator with XRE-family HTH domain
MYKIFEQLLQKNGVSTYKVSKETGIAQSVFSSWKNGISTPKQDKLQKIADYFGVTIEYLMTGKDETVKAVDEDGNIVVIDDETRELIDSLRKNPEMKMLFSVSKKATKEDIIKTVKIIEALKEGE